ncbi:MAG: hypothetical protein Q9171_003348 [Xanthocarpia ochracea]
MSYPDKALDLAAKNGKTHPSSPVPEFSVCLSASLEPDEKLPQVDGGPAAWRFLFAIFVMEALQWGFAFNYGVFQNYYFEHEPFRGNPSLSVVGTVATGGFYLGAPIMTPLVKRWPRWQKPMVWIGWALMVLGLVGASFATTLPVLIATQGVIYTTGITIMYWPMLSMQNEWFVAKRGLAFGTTTAATGVSGLVMPFALAALLNKYGYATTLRAFAVTLVAVTGPFLPLIKGRLPASHAIATTKTDMSFMTNHLFYFFAAAVLLQGLGYFFPTLYLPSYAEALGYRPTIGALLLALFSLAQVFGQIGVGYMSDNKVSVWTLALVLPFVSGTAVITLWGLGHSLPPLIIFSLVYGLSAGSYIVLWARMGMQLGDDQTVALTTFGAFAFLKGVGNVVTGPVGAGLMLSGTRVQAYGLEKYKWVVVYCGTCMFASSTLMAVLFLKTQVAKRR